MKGARMTIQDIKASKVGKLNEAILNEALKPQKKSSKCLPIQPAPQVMWMWGQLVAWSLANGIHVVQEHKFHPERKWRFDFALPDKKIGIEYEGLNSSKSGHTTLQGYTKDTEKYREAAIMGWTLLRYTVKNYKILLKDLDKCMNEIGRAHV